MNILYILGNGFDKAQGMKTSYPEFYPYLEQQVTLASTMSKINQSDSSLDLIKKMLQAIKNDTVLWSDMEEALGQFTTVAASADEFEEMYYQVSDSLRQYLKNESAKFQPTKEYKEKIRQSFLLPSMGLKPLDKQRYNTTTKPMVDSSKNINIITLNYTDTIEKLLDIDHNLPKIFGNAQIRNIRHIHGTLDGTIIIGVDNINQIANETFQKDEDVQDILVKQQSNIAMKVTRHQSCEELIKNAHVIVIYGASLGLTDERWWRLIGEQMMQRSNLVLIDYVYDKKGLDNTRSQLLGRLERKYKKRLIERMHIDETEKISNRIFIPICSDIFSPATTEDITV